MTIRFKGGYHGSTHVLATTLNELFNFNVYKIMAGVLICSGANLAGNLPLKKFLGQWRNRDNIV